jgi:hypothetical protein
MEEPKKKQSVQQQQEGVDNGYSIDDAQENGLQPLEEGLAKEHEEGLIQDFSGGLSLVEDSDPSSVTPSRHAIQSSHAIKEVPSDNFLHPSPT